MQLFCIWSASLMKLEPYWCRSKVTKDLKKTLSLVPNNKSLVICIILEKYDHDHFNKNSSQIFVAKIFGKDFFWVFIASTSVVF